MRLWLGGFAVVLGMAAPVSADIAIRGARIAEGDLWVLGQVDEPNTTITLDDSYFEKTDQQGRFEFRLGYHPAACTVILKTERQSRVVVIANCGQRGPAGPVGQAGPPGPAGPTGQVGPPGSSGSAAAPAAPLEARQSQGPRLDVSCGQKAALYEAPNGFRIWITRKGLLRSSSSRPQPAQAEVVLQVAIGGQTASLRGPDYTSMVRGGPPQEIEEASRQLINWERLTDALPGAIEIVSDTGSGSLARLTFKECGSAPRAPRPSPAAGADADRPDAPPPRPLPQGALPDGPQLSQP